MAKSELRSRDRFLWLAALLTGTSVFLAITGPFGTFGTGGFPMRLLHWAGIVWVSAIVAGVAIGAVRRWINHPVWLREAVTIALFVAVFVPLEMAWTEFLFPGVRDKRFSLSFTILAVLVTCTLISLLRYGVPAFLALNAGDNSDQTVAPRITRRLPDCFNGRVLRLEADGHVVKVVTTQGDFDVRMRMRDATDEMQGAHGGLVHRSHWVAFDDIKETQVERGRPFLVLNSGDKVPVGPTYQTDLEAAGVLCLRGMGTENA